MTPGAWLDQPPLERELLTGQADPPGSLPARPQPRSGGNSEPRAWDLRGYLSHPRRQCPAHKVGPPALLAQLAFGRWGRLRLQADSTYPLPSNINSGSSHSDITHQLSKGGVFPPRPGAPSRTSLSAFSGWEVRRGENKFKILN